MNEQVLETNFCEALVLGGGIAGCWTALKLARAGVSTTLVYYGKSDRGGRLGSTGISVGAVSTAPIDRPDYAQWLSELGRGQVQSSVVGITEKYLAQEIEALKEFDPLKEIALGYALHSGSGRKLLQALLKELSALGVRIIDDAWVVAILADTQHCTGIQYWQNDRMCGLQAGSIVIASGGYSGLFQGAVKTGTYGSIHGRFLQAGGKLSNLEFVFKHGYGQPDLGKLTPTEELPGVEIYDENGVHVEWLEVELFEGRGTHNHFRAFMTWRKNKETHYFVDFRFTALHRYIKKQLSALHELEATGDAPSYESLLASSVATLVDQLSDGLKAQSYKLLVELFSGKQQYDIAVFSMLKELFSDVYPLDKHRIRQISYFSMGGVMHHQFKTNLHNVFVAGEAMHDYGAHRVGGLPWALYLCSAKYIADTILTLKDTGKLVKNDIIVSEGKCHFNASQLADLQMRLFESLECGEDTQGLVNFCQWIRTERRALQAANETFNDYYAYLLLAEAIAASGLARRESRGCFFRKDFSHENNQLDRYRTVAAYDQKKDEVCAYLVDKSYIYDLVFNGKTGIDGMDSRSIQFNAVHYLLKKHLNNDVADKAAIIFEERSLSYSQLNVLTEQYAHFLFSNGIVAGDRVLLLLNDSPDWIAMFLACLQVNVIAVPVNTFCKEHDLRYFLQDSGAKLLVSEDALLMHFDIKRVLLDLDVRVINLSDIDISDSPRFTSCTAVNDDTPAFMLYTSGSTGSPKGVLHSHASLEYTALNFAQPALDISSNDRLFSSSRLFFAYGLGNSLTFPLYFGASVVLTRDKINPVEIFDFIDRHAISVYFSIPALYATALANVPASAAPQALRICVSAGEPMPATVGHAWSELTQKPLVDGIGSTEALHIFCCSYFNPDGGYIAGSAIGQYKVALFDDNNFEIDNINVLGNLAVRGKSIGLQYWNDKKHGIKLLHNGYIFTGDIYRYDADHHLIYVGRKGDTYKSSGLWVSAFDVETAIREVQFVVDAAVVAYLDEHGKQQAKAMLVVTDDEYGLDADSASAQVYRYLSERLSRYKLPSSICIVAALPRTATGKIAKHKLREQLRVKSYVALAEYSPQVTSPSTKEAVQS